MNLRKWARYEHEDPELKFPKSANKRTRWWRVFLAGFTVVVAVVAVLFTRSVMDSSRVRVSSPQELSSYFDEIGYPASVLNTGKAKIPNLTVASVPAGWADGLTVDQKKSLFFRALLPMVLTANAEIKRDRTRLLKINQKLSVKNDVASGDADWVQMKAKAYGLKLTPDLPNPQTLAALLQRVGVIPPSLVLAQGAVESAYGSSRFAVEGNALFGQWKFGDGLIPGEQRSKLGDYRIAVFDTLLDSIRAYMLNLNRHAAYKSFRNLRANARQGGKIPRGAALAAGLLAYSEKGQDYVILIRSIIARNGLSASDGAKLRDMPTVRIVMGPL